MGRKKSKTDAPKEGSSSKQPSPSKPSPNTPRTRAAAAREAAATAKAESQAQPTPIPPTKRYVSSSFHVFGQYYRFNYQTMHPMIQEVALR